MSQVVIGIFDSPDEAHVARENLADQGIQPSAFHIISQEGIEDESGQEGRSADEIRDFLDNLLGQENLDESDEYQEEVRQGAVLLAVEVSDDEETEPIRDAMFNAGMTDMEETEGEEGEEEAAAPGGGEEEEEERQTVPVIEEEMEVGKQQTRKGRVRVISRTVEVPVQEEVTLKEERATVERRPADRPASPEEMQAMGEEERTVEVQEMAERPEVRKSARVVEEVEVGKETTERTETVEDTVRHTEVDVEEEPGQQQSGGKEKGRSKKQ